MKAYFQHLVKNDLMLALFSCFLAGLAVGCVFFSFFFSGWAMVFVLYSGVLLMLFSHGILSRAIRIVEEKRKSK